MLNTRDPTQRRASGVAPMAGCTARPVGAHSRSVVPFAATIRRIDHGGFLDGELHGNRFGSPETNAPNVAGKSVRVFRYQLNGIGAVDLEDPNRS
jgi:hypothetical protein